MKNKLFYDYYFNWIEFYKKGAVKKVTLNKYYCAYRHLKKIVPNLKVSQLTSQSYQRILNEYAKDHSKRTTTDFHRMIKPSAIDAFDEGYIKRDPTRKAVIKGREVTNRKKKFLNQDEFKKLLQDLNLDGHIIEDILIFLIAKTGLRYAEALGLTPSDFDFKNSFLSVNKCWNYKSSDGGFTPTKNEFSIRTIKIDNKTSNVLKNFVKGIEPHEPIFVKKRVFNSTINSILFYHCRQSGIPEITIHSLRHTHASLLLYAGVSIASVSKRLGHSNMNTTEIIYLHIVRELEDKDNDKICTYLNAL